MIHYRVTERVTYIFPGWANAGEKGGSKFVKKPLFGGSMLVVIYNLGRSVVCRAESTVQWD